MSTSHRRVWFVRGPHGGGPVLRLPRRRLDSYGATPLGPGFTRNRIMNPGPYETLTAAGPYGRELVTAETGLAGPDEGHSVTEYLNPFAHFVMSARKVFEGEHLAQAGVDRPIVE